MKLISNMKLKILGVTFSILFFSACDNGGSPAIPPVEFNCAQFREGCCTPEGGPIIEPETGLPPLNCQQPRSEITRRNELALAELSLLQAARSLIQAEELSGVSPSVLPEGGGQLAATAIENFEPAPPQERVRDLDLDNQNLTPSELSTLDQLSARSGGAGRSLAAIGKDFQRQSSEEKGSSSFFGLLPDALKRIGSVFLGQNGDKTKKGNQGEEDGPMNDFFKDEDEAIAAKTEKNSENEVELKPDRALSSFQAPENYFQLPGTRIEKDIFKRVSVKMKKIAIQWWKQSL